jgi:hypothetical protein
MTTYTIELSDVTPNRATVVAVLPGDQRAATLRYSTVTEELLPVVGERVWVRHGTANSRGYVEISGRA